MEAGKRISATYEGARIEGTIVQVKDEEVTLKLKSGYNLIIPITALSDIENLPTPQADKNTSAAHKQDPLLPKVSILHTGGTIASKVDYASGAVVAQFEPDELLQLFPELLTKANITSKLLANMMSENMRFGHYNVMARAILEEINKGASGIILTHGTDTLHYSAAALSFALEGINVPLVLVGSQRSSDRGSSDAATNLVGALTFLLQKQPGVFIAMHEEPSDDAIIIIDGLHARKQHTSRRDAFVSINAKPIARVLDSNIEVLDQERLAAWKERAQDHPRVIPFNEELRIGWWKSHPNAWVDELKAFDSFDGLLIEGTGLGHAPLTGGDEFTREQHPFIREKIRALAKKIPVAMTSQTIVGRVNMDVYADGRLLQEMGVLGHGLDMHPETAFIKLAWLLSNHPKDARELYAKDLRGEISERSPLEDTHKRE